MKEKHVAIEIQRRYLNNYGDKTIYVSTIRRCVKRFSSGDIDLNDKLCYGLSYPAVNLLNEER